MKAVAEVKVGNGHVYLFVHGVLVDIGNDASIFQSLADSINIAMNTPTRYGPTGLDHSEDLPMNVIADAQRYQKLRKRWVRVESFSERRPDQDYRREESLDHYCDCLATVATGDVR